MAIRYKRTQPQAQAFAMAPMVDMVFLLLVFFMCVTAVSGGRARLKIDLPQTATATANGAASSTRKPQIVLSIGEGGALEVNGMACQQAELLALLRRLRTQSEEVPSVRVRAHTHTPYSRIEPVLAACSVAGLGTVSYAAYEVTTVRAAAGEGTVPADGSGKDALAGSSGNDALEVRLNKGFVKGSSGNDASEGDLSNGSGSRSGVAYPATLPIAAPPEKGDAQ